MFNLNLKVFFSTVLSLGTCLNAFSQVGCDLFLKSNVSKVENLKYLAKKHDVFWVKNISLLSIILPEYLAESEEELEAELSIFKTLLFFGGDITNRISLGPFQMQPLFIHKVISNSKKNSRSHSFTNKNRSSDLDMIKNNIDVYVTLPMQLDVFKEFLLMESLKIKKKPINCILEMGRIYNGSIDVKGNNSNFYFSKLNCDKKLYTEWILIFLQYYFNEK